MAKHVTFKSTKRGREMTLYRREVRRNKYRSFTDTLAY